MIKTFWRLLEEFGVEIPPIQRDYAQGRLEGKAPQIRVKFIKAILDALQYDEPLGLDFIYGKIYGQVNEAERKRNKHAIESLLHSIKNYADSVDLSIVDITLVEKAYEKADTVYMIPLDGQQRLTTLFLVHWYFLYRSGHKNELQLLKGFRYKTRKSSENFLQLLVQIDRLEFTGAPRLEIEQDEHFSNTWLDDPTIVSMLNVLNDIHRLAMEIPDINFDTYAQKLVKGNLIYFEFLDIVDFNLEDDLYVKMNARGKQLSEFENFKAWLFGKMETRMDIQKWESDTAKFDIDWNDIFWNAKEKDIFEVDSAYMNYFKLMYLLDLVKTVPVKGNNFVGSVYPQKIDKILTNSSSFDFELDFDDHFLDRVEHYFRLLDILTRYGHDNNGAMFFLSGKGIKPTWQDLIRNYILISYIVSKDKPLRDYDELDHVELSSYRRVMGNLFENSEIDNQSLYKKAINEIDQITGRLARLNFVTADWATDLLYQSDSAFGERQVKEERLKAILLLRDSEWRSLILKAESHRYFMGELNILFFLSEMSMEPNGFREEYLTSIYKDRFSEYSKKLFLLIGPEGFDRVRFKENIFERALLTRCDYLLSQAGNKCFGRDTDRDVSWKRFLLRDRNSEETNLAIKEIFSSLDFESPKDSFEAFIFQNNNDLPAYREVFVSNHKLFRSLNSLKYIRQAKNHGWVMITEGYKTNTASHYELFSRDFFCRYLLDREPLLPFGTVGYYATGKDDPEDLPCAVMKWDNMEFTYTMDIFGHNQKYRLRFYQENDNYPEHIVNALLDKNFRYNDNDYVSDFDSREKTYANLLIVCNALNALAIEN